MESLLQRGVAPERIVATGRNTAAAEDLAACGVAVRHADFDRPETLAAAFEGATVVLLVSTTQIGSRNSFYLEVYTEQIPSYPQQGAILGAAGEGRISGAARADFAEAEAEVLIRDGLYATSTAASPRT